MNRLCLLLFCVFLSPLVSSAADFEIFPFQAVNQSPILRIYGLPHYSGADVVSPGIYQLSLTDDLSSNYSVSRNAHEQVELDGETNLTTFSIRYGIAPGWEAGIDIPYVSQGGGLLDRFIIDWHNTFGLPQGGRDSAPKNRLNFGYRKDGAQQLNVHQSASGIGDITVTGGYSLYDFRDAGHHDRLTLRGAVKLPTGDSASLLGSGGTDFLLQLCGGRNSFGDWGTLGVYGSVGGLVMSGGDVLSGQRNPVAGVGMLGIGWGAASWISFKAQLYGSTPFYHGSSLTEVSGSPLALIFGGTLKFPGEYLLDIGVAEDIAVATAPDVSLHLGLSRKF